MNSDIIRFFTPLIVSYFVANWCPITESAGQNVKARPPGYVFAIVWPILYILIGLSWIKAPKTMLFDLLFASLVACLCLWLVFYGCIKNKQNALYILLLTIVVVLVLLVMLEATTSVYLIPLIVWLFFALLLSFTEINTQKSYDKN